MAAKTTQYYKGFEGKVGCLPGTIKPSSISDSVTALIAENGLNTNYVVPVFEDTTKAHANFAQAVSNALADRLEVMQKLGMEDQFDMETYVGYTQDYLQALGEKMVALLTDGSIASNVIKAHLMAELNVNDAQWSPPKAQPAKAGKITETLDLDTDISIDDI